jgi:hypothetical protein
MSALAAATLIGAVSCTKAEQIQIISAITPVAACIADVVIAVNGIEDPVAIASNCGAAVSDVYQIVSSLLANYPTADAGLAMTTTMRSHLTRIQINANNIMQNQTLTTTR